MHSGSIASNTHESAVRTITVCSGKGGVGKTNVAVNLAVELAGSGFECCMLDADFSLANIDVLLGLQPQYNLSNLLSGEVPLEKLIMSGPRGVGIVPAASGSFSMTDLDESSMATIVHAFDTLATKPEFLIVDAAAGIAPQVARVAQASQTTIVVVEDEPASLTDAYALIKVFSNHYRKRRFSIVTNRSSSAAAARQLFRKLQQVTDRYLEVQLQHLGDIPADRFVKLAAMKQRAVVDAYPNCAASRAYKNLATSMAREPLPVGPQGGIEFFFESLVSPASRGRVA